MQTKSLMIAALTALLLAFSSSASAFFWDNDDWDSPWDDNDWPEFTPMYWMEEFADEWDDDDDYYRYGPYGGYGYGPYRGYGAPYGYYAPRYPGYGYPPRGYGYGYRYYPQYQYPQQAPVQPQQPAPAPAPQQ